jgi:hypothetical protein
MTPNKSQEGEVPISYVWLDKQGLRSSEGLEVQYTGRFTMEVRWGIRRKSLDVEGIARPHDFVASNFERWDNSAVPNDIAEQRRILAAFQAALALLNEGPTK